MIPPREIDQLMLVAAILSVLQFVIDLILVESGEAEPLYKSSNYWGFPKLSIFQNFKIFTATNGLISSEVNPSAGFVFFMFKLIMRQKKYQNANKMH
jgi:hypothetical protein